MSFTVEVSKSDVRRLEKSLRGINRGAETAISRGINKTASAAKTQVIRRISEKSGYQKKVIRPHVTVDKANRSKLSGKVRITGGRIPVIQMKARQTRRGVAFSREGMRKLIRSGFIATMSSGHEGAFRRTSGSRLPIKEQFGPSVLTIYIRDVEGEFEIDLSEMLEKNIATQVDLILERARRR